MIEYYIAVSILFVLLVILMMYWLFRPREKTLTETLVEIDTHNNNKDIQLEFAPLSPEVQDILQQYCKNYQSQNATAADAAAATTTTTPDVVVVDPVVLAPEAPRGKKHRKSRK